MGYVDYYARIILLIAPYLNPDMVRRVLDAKETILSTMVNAGHMGRDSITTLIRKRTRVKVETIETILYYQSVGVFLCGTYDHPKRKRMTASKGMTKERYREFYVERIERITCFNKDEIRNILIANEKPNIDLMVEFGFLPCLSDEMQEYFKAEINERQAAELAAETGYEAWKIKAVLGANEAVHELCGEP